jgi:hypothetical protein
MNSTIGDEKKEDLKTKSPSGNARTYRRAHW